MTKRQAFAGAICDLLPFFPMLYILVGLAFLPKPPPTAGGGQTRASTSSAAFRRLFRKRHT